MGQRFLTYDRIVASVGQWQGGHVALDNPDLAVQANTPCQLRSTRNSRRRQFDTGDKCTIAVRQVTGWAASSAHKSTTLVPGPICAHLAMHRWRRWRHSGPDRAGTVRPDVIH